MKWYVFIVTLSLLLCSVGADEENAFDTLNLVQGKSNYISLNTVIQPNDDLDLDDFNEEDNFDFQEYNLDSSFRFQMNEIFSMDIGFEARHYNLFIDFFNVDVDAYLLDLNLGFNFLLTPQFLLAVVLSPGIHSDFDGFDHRHLYFDGSIKAAFSPFKELAFSAGIKLYPRSDGFRLLPFFGLFWNPTDFFSLNILAPFEAEATYKITDKFSLFANYTGVIDDQFRANIFDDKEDNTQITSYRAGVGGKYKIADNVTLSGLFGVTLGGRVNGEEESQDGDRESGEFFAEVGLDIDFFQPVGSVDKDSEKGIDSSMLQFPLHAF